MSDQDIFSAYLNGLEEAASEFRQLDSQQQEGAGRRGAMMALKATIDFIDAATGDRVLRDPLFRLFQALGSAEDGAIDPMLCPVAVTTKRPMPHSERAQRGFLAAAMEIVMSVDGEKRETAAQWVAHQAKKLPVFRKVKSSAWKAVQEWRDSANGANADYNSIDSILFRDALAGLGETTLPQGTGRKAARFLIERAHHLGNPER